MDRDEYRKYLKGPQWGDLVAIVTKRFGNRCAFCNADGKTRRMHVHHRTYERLLAESPEDLTLVCVPCHTTLHRTREIPGQPGWITRHDRWQGDMAEDMKSFEGVTWEQALAENRRMIAEGQHLPTKA